MRELAYRFPNPHNSCEEVYYCYENKRYYVLLPLTPYSKQLCTCTPYRGYYEADSPVRAGLEYLINGEKVVTEGEGEIVDHVKKEAYENKEISFFRIKPEFMDLPNYEIFSRDRLFLKPYDYMKPEHLEQMTLRRKDVCCFMGGWHKIN